METAQALQADIEKSRKLASDIVKQAEVDEERIRSLAEHETHVAFLEREQLFNNQLVETLHSVKEVWGILYEVEMLVRQGQVIEPLHVLEGKA